MGTTQKGIFIRTIGMIFAAGCMGKSGGHFVPSSNYGADNGSHKLRGSTKVNNRTPLKVRYSFIGLAYFGIEEALGVFLNLSTGERVIKTIAATAGADHTEAKYFTKSTQQYFGV